MSKVATVAQPRLSDEEDLRRALVEIVDALNRAIEEINRLVDLMEPAD